MRNPFETLRRLYYCYAAFRTPKRSCCTTQRLWRCMQPSSRIWRPPSGSSRNATRPAPPSPGPPRQGDCPTSCCCPGGWGRTGRLWTRRATRTISVSPTAPDAASPSAYPSEQLRLSADCDMEELRANAISLVLSTTASGHMRLLKQRRTLLDDKNAAVVWPASPGGNSVVMQRELIRRNACIILARNV